jgi:tRNA pseudouridine13 synthase
MTAPSFRTLADDFFVDEVVPPRTPQEGEHLHIRVEKRELSTDEAVRAMATAFGIAPAGVGRCGRKDVHAVTRQWLSFSGVSEVQLEGLDLPGLNVLESVRLPRKLRMGRFLGNRFRIRVRHLKPEECTRAEARLREAGLRGMRNAFGEQRFGKGGENARIGRLLLCGDFEGALTRVALAGGPRVERIRGLLRAGRATDALRILGRRRAGFYVSAHQADGFNRVLKERGEDYDKARSGDLLHRHKSGRLLTIPDAGEAKRRVSTFELSPTGPLAGPRMQEVSQDALVIERRVLADEPQPDPASRRWFGCMGARRPMRVPVTEIDSRMDGDDLGAFLELNFRLPPGAFATALLKDVLECRPPHIRRRNPN